MSLTDLAFCSTWGCNRVQEHQSLAPLQLILPVLTDPGVVKHAVAALHSGSVQLSLCSVEAILVLANSIGVECLESACIQYLCSKTPEMQQMVLLRAAKLGDHLGLAKICEAAAEALVQLPWKDCITSDLAEVIEMPVYKLCLEKKRQLLHHAKRGAFAEVQVFELLEHTRTPETDIAQILQIASLQPQELHVLVRILSHADRTPGPLLAKAVQQHVTPLLLRKEIDWNTCTRFSEDIVQLPIWKSGWEHEYKLPKTDFSLHFQATTCNGKVSTALFLKPGPECHLTNLVYSFTFFEVHTSAPYLRYYSFIDRAELAGHVLSKGNRLDTPIISLTWWLDTQQAIMVLTRLESAGKSCSSGR